MANEVIKGMGFHHIALKCKDIEKSLQMYKAL
jgi:catechol 2,3-dioxygenase-like lactoylglutathione lyase family enzyme